MRIDRKLNLVIPIVRSDGVEIYTHSTPIGADIFDKYFLVIAKTFTAIYTEGLGAIGGPRIADKMLKRVAEQLGVWDTPDGVERGLVNEMRRLTNVVFPGNRGWDSLMFDDAVKNGAMDEADAVEVLASLTFFTVASCMHKRGDLQAVLSGGMSIWGARIESSSCTEFMRSLPTSIVAASSGGKAA
jgi:hypothetical protein